MTTNPDSGPNSDHAPFLAAARDAMLRSADAYRDALAIYADWLEERAEVDADGRPAAARLRTMIVEPAVVAWAGLRGIMLPDCELLEGVPWVVYRLDGEERETLFTQDGNELPPAVAEWTGAPPGIRINAETIGFGRQANRQPCEGEYLGRAPESLCEHMAATLQTIPTFVILYSESQFPVRFRWRCRRLAWKDWLDPRYLKGDGVQSLLMHGTRPTCFAVRYKSPPAKPPKPFLRSALASAAKSLRRHIDSQE